jgi:hypothetical protein
VAYLKMAALSAPLDRTHHTRTYGRSISETNEIYSRMAAQYGGNCVNYRKDSQESGRVLIL